MSNIDLYNEIFNILQKTFTEEQCKQWILSPNTCSETEVVYLFIMIEKKYHIPIDTLCKALDDYLTMDKLVQIIVERRN